MTGIRRLLSHCMALIRAPGLQLRQLEMSCWLIMLLCSSPPLSRLETRGSSNPRGRPHTRTVLFLKPFSSKKRGLGSASTPTPLHTTPHPGAIPRAQPLTTSASRSRCALRALEQAIDGINATGSARPVQARTGHLLSIAMPCYSRALVYHPVPPRLPGRGGQSKSLPATWERRARCLFLVMGTLDGWPPQTTWSSTMYDI